MIAFPFVVRDGERIPMYQMTFQLDKNSEEALNELKELLGTKSSAAAIRSAIALAKIIVPTGKKGRIVVRDQNKNEDISIVLAG